MLNIFGLITSRVANKEIKQLETVL